jgi:hypothetical protein
VAVPTWIAVLSRSLGEMVIDSASLARRCG